MPVVVSSLVFLDVPNFIEEITPIFASKLPEESAPGYSSPPI